MDTDNQRITGYLVGDLPETEQEELERQYFSDPAVIERVTEVESRLLDAYARGQLSDDMRERVARRYLTHPVRRERLKFAEALAARLDDFEPADARREKRPSGRGEALGWWTGPGRTVRFSMTFAVLMLAATAGWLFVERIRLQESLHRVQESDATREQRERELEQQLTTERRNAEAVTADRDRLRAQQSNPSDAAVPTRPTPAVVSLVLAIGGLRSPDDLPRTLKMPPGTEQVRFQLNLKENSYVRYGIILQTVGGAEVLSRQGLQAEKAVPGWVLVITAPARRLAPGDYMLTLSGVTRGGDRDQISTSVFRVEQ
jgi:hypothetical protein